MSDSSKIPQWLNLILILFASFLTVSLLLAIFGLFKKPIILAILILEIVFFIFSLILKRNFEKLSWNKVVIIFLILFITLFIGLFHQSIPHGRDEMAYLSSSAKISEKGSLKFKDIFSRPFHPFRNLGNDIFTSQFLPGYSVYLSIFYTLGNGLKSLWWANPILFFLTLLVLYYIGKNLVSRKVGLITVLLYSSFYSTLWFARRTNCENLFAFLIWTGILFFILGYKNKNPKNLFLGLFLFSLSCFVRGEGLAYLLIYLVILISLALTKKLMINNYKLLIANSLPTLFNLFLLISYFKIYRSTYLTNQGKTYLETILRHKLLFVYGLGLILILFVILKIFKKNKSIKIRNIIFITIFLALTSLVIYYLKWLNIQEKFTWSSLKYYYLFGSLFKYGLFLYLLIIYFGLFKKLFSKLEYLIILLLFPSFLFLLEPGIALDHPWMMRRFQAVFIPLLFLLTALAIGRFFYKSKSVFVGIVCLFLFNLSFSWPILAFSEYKGIQPQLESFAKQFTKKDLILCEPGWTWQQWSYAWHYLYGLNILPKTVDAQGNIVYTKNELKNIAQKYDRLFLLTAKGDFKHPYFEESQYKYEFSFELIWPELEKIGPSEKNLTKRYISERLKKIPPSHIEKRKIELAVYKIELE